MTRIDAGAKLSGAALFGTDLDRPGMLWGALVPAPVAHGRIVSVDGRGARAMPGVVAAIGPEELRTILPSAQASERPVFPNEEVTYRGQPVGAVAARTLAEARSAAAAFRVSVEPLPVVTEIEQRFPRWPGSGAGDSPGVVAHVRARSGDVESAFASADLLHSETYRTAGVLQVPLEPHACLADASSTPWRVTTSTQTPFGVREDASDILGVPLERIAVEGTWVGGGFGSKGAAFLEPYALALSAASGRPVRLALTYPEEFALGRSTLSSIIRLDTAVAGGRITGRRVRLLLESGASLPGRDFATGYSIGFLLGPYRCDAYEVEGYAVQTHKPPFGPHRAPFAPQCAFAVESHLDGLARRLGSDPVAFRLAHVWRTGDVTFLGQPVAPFGAARALERAGERLARWRRDAPAGHGLGVALGFWSTNAGAGGEARVRLAPAGLTIEQGEREIGSGSVIRGLAAVAERATGLPEGAITVAVSDTATAPYDAGVFGSRTVAALGGAVEAACRQLLGTLAERVGEASLRLALGPEGVEVVRASRRDPLARWLTEAERADGGIVRAGACYAQSPPIDESRVLDGTFYPYTDFTAVVHVCEVDVDRQTGSVRVERSASIHDVGTVLDPTMVRGQAEGGVVMGLGTALSEETLWDGAGRLRNPGLLDYRIPTIEEVPPIEVETVEGEPGAGPFGAKGMGEPPIIPVPAAVANAVADALGVRVYELPLTPERVSASISPHEPERPA